MKSKKLIKLFFDTFIISSFTFGGGYVIVPLIKSKFVDELKWIDESEMLDLISIAQSSPGAMAVNVSMLVGYKIYGILGAFICIIATILPPLIIITAIALFYEFFSTNVYVINFLKGMQAGVSAVIFSVVFDLSKKIYISRNYLNYVLLIISIILKLYFNINVAKIMLLCAFVGFVNGIISVLKEVYNAT